MGDNHDRRRCEARRFRMPAAQQRNKRIPEALVVRGDPIRAQIVGHALEVVTHFRIGFARQQRSHGATPVVQANRGPLPLRIRGYRLGPMATSQLSQFTDAQPFRRLGRPSLVALRVGRVDERPDLVEAGPTRGQEFLEMGQVEESLAYMGKSAGVCTGVSAVRGQPAFERGRPISTERRTLFDLSADLGLTSHEGGACPSSFDDVGAQVRIAHGGQLGTRQRPEADGDAGPISGTKWDPSLVGHRRVNGRRAELKARAEPATLNLRPSSPRPSNLRPSNLRPSNPATIKPDDPRAPRLLSSTPYEFEYVQRP